MDQYELIRTAHRVYGKSIRQIAREYGHSRKTIRKVLSGLLPAYRRTKKPPAPIMGPFVITIEEWLRDDLERPKNQRHTARRVFARLAAEHGFTGSETTVRRWVRICKSRLGLGKSQAVIPLDPDVAREAEVDWGTARVRMKREVRTVKILCMRSRYSGKSFVCAYPWERQEMFLDGLIRAFDFYGGVFPVLVFDNLKAAVLRILKGKGRIEQERFRAFRSYYTFEARYCNPGMGREKGGVEGLVGYARRNFLVPLPEVNDFTELNEVLLKGCMEHGHRHVGGRGDDRTIHQRHEEERSRLLPLPERPFENEKVVRVRVSSYQTAQVDRNRYSVPTPFVGQRVWAHVSCDKVMLYAGQRKIAEHARLFNNSKWQIDPLHYLELIAERVQAFDSARPIRRWRMEWPLEYEIMLKTLRRRLGDNKGTRDFVRILQLHQNHRAPRVEQAVKEAVDYQCYSFDAVKHLLLAKDQPGFEVRSLPPESIPGITDREVTGADVSRYNSLLAGGAL